MPAIPISKEALVRQYIETRNPELINEIIERHEKLIKRQLANPKNPHRPALQYLHERGHTDDLIQEGRIALYNSLIKYDPAKQQFYKYAWANIYNAIKDATNKLIRQLRPQTYNQSIDDRVTEDEYDELKELPEQARRALTEKEYEIIAKRYGIGQPEQTDEEIAGKKARNGITRKRNSALEKLRNNPRIKIFS